MASHNFITLTTFTLLLVLISSTLACNINDKKALIALKNSFPPNTFPISSWNSTQDCCYWENVHCNKYNGRVMTLSISGNKHIKTIPKSILNFPFLSVLTLSNLPNLKSLPAHLTKLSKLQILYVQDSGLSGNVPEFLPKLRYLREINLPNNKLTGQIPVALGAFRHLKLLDLSGNKLEGNIPPVLGYSSLIYLYLSNNRLTGDIPKSFQGAKFVSIILSNNKLTGDSAMVLFGKSKPATQIAISNNQIAFNLSTVEFPRKLESLDISHNKIYGSIPNQITELPNLSYINVSYNNLCGKLPSGGKFREFGAQFYDHNKCLCGTPLSPCK